MNKYFATKRLSIITLLTAVLMLGLPGCNDDDDNASSEEIALQAGNICTGSTTGTYYHYAEGVIDAAKETLGFDLENISTVGTLENAKAIASGRCDMAIVQADIYVQAGTEFHSSAEFKLFSANMGSVAALYKEPVHILVNRDSGITTVADLAGKKVNVGERDSGTFLTANKLLNIYHQVSPAPEYVYEAPSTAVAKVVDGSIDATFYVAAAPISILANLPADANVTLIPATIPVFSSEYNTTEISATTYPWLYSDITNNIAVWSLLTVGQSIDRTKLGAFLDALYANKDSYATKYHAKWSQFDKASTIAAINMLVTSGWNREVTHYFADAALSVVEPQPYFCSASTTGTYTKVVKDLLPVVESTLGISLAEVNTAGSLENLQKLYNGECAMALIQDDVGGYVASSVDRTGQTISEDMLMAQSARAIMPLYAEDIHLVVNNGSGIDSSSDLVGKKVNLGNTGSGTFMSANTTLLVNGIRIEDITPFYESSSMALAKVISGEYDAMFVTSKAPVSYLLEADCPTDIEVEGCIAGDPTTLPIKLVQIKGPDLLMKTTFSSSHYPWQNEDIPGAPQVMATLFVSPNLSFTDTQIVDFINAIYEIPVDDTTISPTWDETIIEQGVIHFQLVTYLYDWLAAQYFAERM